jgi:hypothetical protein
MKRALGRVGTPLAFYYAVTVVLPLANGARGPAFVEHALVVIAVPSALIASFCVARAGTFCYNALRILAGGRDTSERSTSAI